MSTAVLAPSQSIGGKLNETSPVEHVEHVNHTNVQYNAGTPQSCESFGDPSNAPVSMLQQDDTLDNQSIVQGTESENEPNLPKSDIRGLKYLKACPFDGCTVQLLAEAMRLHRQKVHDDNEAFYHCLQCNSRFARKSALNYHMQQHDISSYTCQLEECSAKEPPEEFKSLLELQRHQKSTHLPKCPFDVCGGKVFSTRQRLKEHLKVHEKHGIDNPKLKISPTGKIVRSRVQGGDDEFPCDVDGCEKSYKSKYRLEQHMKSNHSGIRYRCDACGKDLISKESLARHKAAVHDAKVEEKILSPSQGSLRKIHACSICGKVFQRPGRLQHHMTVHMRESNET